MILVPHRMVFRPRPSASASASARLQAAGAGFAALSRCRIGCCCNVVGVGLCAKRSYSSKLNRPRSTRARPWQSPLPPPPPPSTLDEIVPPTVPPTDVQAAALRQFIENHPRLLVLTGAGLSTESGIPDYRSPYATSPRSTRSRMLCADPPSDITVGNVHAGRAPIPKDTSQSRGSSLQHRLSNASATGPAPWQGGSSCRPENRTPDTTQWWSWLVKVGWNGW
eukprot:SAG31_NODE_5_length_43735_cov_42.922266_22_plen_223_part_00